MAFVACAHESTAKETVEPRQTFPIASAAPVDTSYEREYVGEVHAIRYAEVRSRLKGVIENVGIDEGETVEADRLLFSIRAKELQQELLKTRAAAKSVEAELKLATLERENTQMLFDKKVVSGAELALADAKIQALQAKLDEAKASSTQSAIDVAYTKVRAPFAGTVNRIPHKVGSLVDENDLLTTLTDTSEVLVYYRVSEREYLEYQGLPAERRPKRVALKLADGSIHPSLGVIDATESEFSKETGNIAFRARFPNPARTLKHGNTGKIVIKTELPQALLVPQKSTFEVQGKLYVFSLDSDSRAHAREIVPQVRLKDAFVVGSGLSPGERFVLEGVQKLKEGTRVDAVPAS